LVRSILFAALLSILVILTAALPVSATSDIEQHRSCTHCGMDRKAYGFSRMLVSYADGSQRGVCSLHCAITELNAHPDKKIVALQVADRISHDLLDAASAFWVKGGRKRGVMTSNPTWAFATKEAAAQFIRDYGGTLSTWEIILAAARKDAAR
jgi:copper chaperone NosL